MEKNELLIEIVKEAKKKAVVQICEGRRCVDARDEEELKHALEELG